MSSELIVTSAIRGLQAGRSGFTTVLRTRGIHPDLAARLEAASGYRHLYPQGDPRNPVIFSYTQRQSAIGDVWVISRIADAGNDYTGRSNKIAHHIALQETDVARLAASNPAAVIMALDTERVLAAHWSGEPREAAVPPRIPAPPVEAGVCQRWAVASGDAGWAGYLAERALNQESTWIVAPPTVDLLELFSEALSLVPPAQRWRVPFTTFSLRGDEGRWLGVTAGTPEADAAVAQQRIPVIDLRKHTTAPSSSAFVLAARGDGPLPWQRAAAVPTAISASGSVTATRQPGQRVSGERGVPGPPPMLRPAPLWPPSPSAGDGRGDGELPPLPPMPGRFGQRRLLLLSFGIVGALLLLAGSALAAYSFDALPAGWRKGIDTWAWRRQLRTEPPEEIAKAHAVVRQIDDAVTPLKKKLEGQRTAEAMQKHPILPKQWKEIQDAKTKLQNVLIDDAQLRAIDFEADLKPCVDEAEKALNAIGWVVGEAAEPVIDLHLKCAAALLKQSPDGQNEQGGRAVTEAQQKLVEGLRKHSRPEDVKSLESLLAALEKARTPSKGSPSTPTATAGQETAQAPGPKARSLLSRAIEDNKHMPLKTLLASEAENESVTIVRWDEKAAPGSLKDVNLIFPRLADDEPSVSLKRIAVGGQSVAWECFAGESQMSVGSFTLTTTSLDFQTKNRTNEGPYPWQFLPLLICKDGDPEKFDTWLQLITPQELDALQSSNRKPAPVPVIRQAFSESRNKVLEAIFKPEHVRWQSLQVQASGDPPVEILPQRGTTPSTKLSLDSLPMALWWRPRFENKNEPDEQNEPGRKSEGVNLYHEDLDVSQAIKVAGGDVTLDVFVKFKVDDFLNHMEKDRVLKDLVQFSKNRKGISASDWHKTLNKYAGYVLELPHDDWQKLAVSERMEKFKAVYPEPPKDHQKYSFAEWIRNLRDEIVKLHVEDVKKKFGTEPEMPGQAPTKPDASPSDAEQEKYKTQHEEWTKKKKLRDEFDKVIKDAEDSLKDDGAFQDWVKERMASKECPLDALLLIKLWYDLHRYRVVSSGGFTYLSAVRENEAEKVRTLQGVADQASLRVTGDLVLDWGKAIEPTPSDRDDSTPAVILARVGASRAQTGADRASRKQSRLSTDTE